METTNTPTPATPNELLSENHDLLYKLLAVIENHVNELVQKKVNEIFESHATLTLISDATEFRLKEIVTELIDEHESDNDHPSRDDISDDIATHIAHTNFDELVRGAVETLLSDGDYATEERVQEMIDEHDFEESVKEVLRNI